MNKIGRPKTFEKEEILKLAMFHFWEYGYSSTNLDELLKYIGIKRSSFYRTFKSKEEIFSLSLDLYRKETFAWLRELQQSIGTKEALLEMIKSSIYQVQERGKVKGCLLMNSGKECYQKHSSLSHQIAIEFDALLLFVTQFIDQAQAKNEIRNTLDAKKLAMRYLMIYNGAIMLLQAGASAEEVEESLDMAKLLLE